jgi:predicted DCC family thiol-disulfide oxidoreductase YuxK
MARDKAGQVLALPNQTPNLIQHYGLTRADVDREAWAIERGGRKLAGAEAINRVWRELGGLRSVLASLYSFPPVRWIEDRVYRWIATHRSLLSRFYSTTPECERPGIRCE